MRPGTPRSSSPSTTYDGLVTTTGHSFQVPNIQVSRVRSGQIVTSRDYHNHPVLADAAAQGLAARTKP